MPAYLTGNQRFKHGNVAFVLGAGASYDHGYPLVGEFLSPKYLRWLCDQCAGLPAGDGDSAKMLSYALDEAESFRRISNNFEEVLSRSFDDGEISYERVLNFADWLLATAWNVVHSSDLMTTVEYLGLAIIVLEMNRAGNSCIITFNYDTATEDAISSASRILRTMGSPATSLYFNYGFKTPMLNTQPEHFLNFGTSVLPDAYPDGLVQILKLHGSINTKICGSCSALHYAPNEGHSAAWSNTYFKTCRACGKSSLKLLMVPPGKRKKIPAVFEELWTSAQERIGSSELVVIAGYSLPAYDEEARALLEATLKNKDVLLVDPHPNADAINFLTKTVRAKLQVLQQTTSAFLSNEVNSYNSTIFPSFAEHCRPRYLNPELLQGHPR